MNEDAQFTSGGSLIYTIRFLLINDTIGLEDIENYNLILENPQPSRNVELGNKEINIVDDDGTYVIYIYIYNQAWGQVLWYLYLSALKYFTSSTCTCI